MKRTSSAQFLFATSVLCLAGLPAFAQEEARPQFPQEERVQERRLQEEGLQQQRLDEERLQEQRLQAERLKELRLQRLARQKHQILYVTPEMKKGRPTDLAQIWIQAAAGATIPLWHYSQAGYDSNNYAGMMVGRSPFFHGKRTTVVPTVIVPVKLTFADTGTIFDPSAPDVCAPGGASVVSLVLNSPIFQNTAFTMDGVNVGPTQYLDAFQRASFWSLVSGTPFHTVFTTSPTVLPVQSVTVPTLDGSTNIGICRNYGTMLFTWFDNYVQTTLIPSLSGLGVGPLVFPQIVLDSAFELIPACCATGYHNSFLNGGVFQSYSVNAWDTSGFVGGTTDTMSHEVAEWMDDPNTSNPVPSWGHIGQQPNCQPNLEVGDPLTGTSFPSVVLAGVTYDLQELAFFSWFYGGASLGAGGKYSNNGSFSGFAIACPPGGTH